MAICTFRKGSADGKLIFNAFGHGEGFSSPQPEMTLSFNAPKVVFRAYKRDTDAVGETGLCSIEIFYNFNRKRHILL